MTIQFNSIPANLRVPLFFAEIDPRFANTAPATQRGLLIGQIIGTGTYAAGQPVQVSSLADGIAGAGAGSILAGMISAWRLNDPLGELWVLPLADDAGGGAATGSLAVTGTATAAGQIPLYVAGQLVPVAVSVGDTATVIGANIASAIGAALLPVTGLNTTGTVAITARNKGLAGNDIDLRLAYRGSAAGEVMPAGVAIAITAMSGGTVNPSLTTPIANLGDKGFDFIVSSLTDTTSLDALKALLSDSTGRWSPLQQKYGHAFAAVRNTSGSLASLGVARNDQHLTIVGFTDSPSPEWAWAASFAAVSAVSLRGDPALPLQFLAVQGVLAPPIASRFPITVRNTTLLYSGISTWTVDANGTVTTENIVTTYVTNAQGNADNSYLELETMFTLVYVLRFMRARVQAKFNRVKLASDGTRVLPGSNVVTPSTIRADVIAAYRELETAGFVQNSATFAANLVVEKDGANPNRVNILWPGTLIDQLRVFAMLVQFRLI